MFSRVHCDSKGENAVRIYRPRVCCVFWDANGKGAALLSGKTKLQEPPLSFSLPSLSPDFSFCNVSVLSLLCVPIFVFLSLCAVYVFLSLITVFVFLSLCSCFFVPVFVFLSLCSCLCIPVVVFLPLCSCLCVPVFVFLSLCSCLCGKHGVCEQLQCRTPVCGLSTEFANSCNVALLC